MHRPENTEEYIASFPVDVQALLQQVREAIKKAAPQAKEIISYGMPAYRANGNLIHFAAAQKHIGIYPGPAAIVVFKDELSAYKTSKGAIQILLTEPLPLGLIARITRHRVAADMEWAMNRTKK
jgi:uncharacterized protein YdhG (YjbR/CyaY superfamily)